MPTRTIFFHISGLSQTLFYVLAYTALAVCFWGFYRRFRLWRKGKPAPKVRDWPARLRSLFDQAVLHRRTRRRRYAGTLHIGIFFGMIALFIGTLIVGIEHYGEFVTHHIWFYKGAFYLICKVALDLFGLGLLGGTGMALGRRWLARPRNLGHTWKDDGFLALLFVATLTGFLLEGAGLAADPNRAPYMGYSPVGQLFVLPLQGIGVGTYAIFWWVHIPLVLGVIAALPYGRWLHLFVIPATIVMQPERPMGALESISMEEVEETGRIGLAEVTDLDRWQRMSLDGCMECGRCTDACPANAVGKELNPKQIVLDLRNLLTAVERRGKREEGREKDIQAENQEGRKPGNGETQSPTPYTLHPTPSTDIISDASLWACTNCHACVRECPALIRHVDIIDGIRRYRVAEGRLAGTAATMLRQLSSRENPWGLPTSQRLDWAKGMEVAAASAEDGREVLFWVGCAGAFEPRAQKTVRAIAELLQRAGVKFTVLGPKERCTGDPARRTGDEFLFQQLAEANVGTLNGVGAKVILTQCPHCFHTLKNEYPAFGGEYTVLHHTQYLAQLVEQGRLKIPAGFAESVTYHDPCFLARVNGETEAPRKLLGSAVRIPLVEAERRESKTFCCGAGGGRMWMEEDRNQRPGVNRAQELLATGAKTVAVGCPFCKVMVGDSLAQVGGENAPPVLDVAEVMVAALAQAEPQVETLKVERGEAS